MKKRLDNIWSGGKIQLRFYWQKDINNKKAKKGTKKMIKTKILSKRDVRELGQLRWEGSRETIMHGTTAITEFFWGFVMEGLVAIDKLSN